VVVSGVNQITIFILDADYFDHQIVVVDFDEMCCMDIFCNSQNNLGLPVIIVNCQYMLYK